MWGALQLCRVYPSAASRFISSHLLLELVRVGELRVERGGGKSRYLDIGYFGSGGASV